MTTSRHHRRSSRGMATAEYAVGTAGAACLACILITQGESLWGGWIKDVFDRLGSLGTWLDISATKWHLPWRALL